MTVEATPPAAGATGADAGASATPAQAAAGAPSPTPSPAPSPSPTPAAGEPQPYKIPDAYKDKPWAAKIKSEEDLYKQIDTLDALKGKKTVVPDFTKATPSELEQYYAQTRPENKDAYQFADGTDDAIKTGLSETLFKNGITAHQANAVIKDYQAMEAESMKGMFSAEGMYAELEKAFGAEWKETGGATAKILKANLSAEDAAMMDKLPNPFLGLVYRMANNLIKGYGITESGAHTGASAGAQQPGDINKVRESLRTEIAALSIKPHTAEDKQQLVDKLNATYEVKGKK